MGEFIESSSAWSVQWSSVDKKITCRVRTKSREL